MIEIAEQNKASAQTEKQQLLEMCRSDAYNREIADKLIRSGIDVNEPIDGTSYLIDAADYNNYDAVKHLLENGADPNLIVCCCSPLNEMQYTSKDIEGDKIRLEITKLLLENGANPNLVVEDYPICGYADTYDVYDWMLGQPFSYHRRNFCSILFDYGGLTLYEYYTKYDVNKD